MKIFEIGTGYTSIPAKMGAATEIVVEELSNSLLESGHDVTVVDIKDSHRAATSLPIYEVPMPQFFNATDTSLGIVHKLKRVLYSISLAHKLCKLISCCIDDKIILHFHNQYNLFFFLKLAPASIRARVTVAYTVHSYIWFGKWDDICNTVKKRYFQEIYCVRNADHVFVLNDTAKNMFINQIGVAERKIHKITNGVNTSTYNDKAPRSQEIEQFLTNAGLAEKKIIFQVGSVCNRKNQLGSLELLLPTLKKRPDVAFLYAGGIIDLAYKSRIDDFATRNGIAGQVVYAGEVSPGRELNTLYSASHACIFNSKSEAFGLVLLESMSASRPVFVCGNILSTLPAIKSKIRQGIIPITESFGSDLEKLLDDATEYASQQTMARELVEKEYSWNVAAKQYLEHFGISFQPSSAKIPNSPK